MTDKPRLQALKDLREKVGAGLDTAHHHAAAFPSESAYGHCKWHDSHKASSGSIDAAKALHEAVLPEWVVERISWWKGHPARVAIWGTHEDDGQMWHNQKDGRAEGEADTIARAWLLAVLSALIAMEEDQ